MACTYYTFILSLFYSRYSIDYHLLRNYLHILDVWGEERANSALPLYCKTIIDQYRISDDSFRNLENIVLQKKLEKKRNLSPEALTLN